jgi:hypothetical protein
LAVGAVTTSVAIGTRAAKRRPVRRINERVEAFDHLPVKTAGMAMRKTTRTDVSL